MASLLQAYLPGTQSTCPKAALQPKGSDGPTLGPLPLPGLIMCLRDGIFCGTPDKSRLIKIFTELCEVGEWSFPKGGGAGQPDPNREGQGKPFLQTMIRGPESRYQSEKTVE